MKYKQSIRGALALSLGVLSAVAFAQQNKMDEMKGMDMNNTDMNTMDMKSCNDMMEKKSMDMKDMDMTHCMKMMSTNQKPASNASAIHKATGVVRKLDAANGTVTFAHGPVKSMGWPAMTMRFAVKDKKLLDKLSVGKKVDFEFKQDGAEFLVTEAK